MRTARWRPASFAPRPSRLVRARGQGRAQASEASRRAPAWAQRTVRWQRRLRRAHRRHRHGRHRKQRAPAADHIASARRQHRLRHHDGRSRGERGEGEGGEQHRGVARRVAPARGRRRARRLGLADVAGPGCGLGSEAGRVRVAHAPARKELGHEGQREGVAEDVEADERGHCAHAPAAAAHDLLPAADRCQRQWLDSAQLRGREAVDRARAAECWSPGERSSAGHAVSSRHQR